MIYLSCCANQTEFTSYTAAWWLSAWDGGCLTGADGTTHSSILMASKIQVYVPQIGS